MKNYTLGFVALALSLMLTSCEAAGTVFQAGKWYGIIIAVLVVAVILFFMRGRGK